MSWTPSPLALKWVEYYTLSVTRTSTSTSYWASPPFQGMELQLNLQSLELYVDIVTYPHLSGPDGIQ